MNDKDGLYKWLGYGNIQSKLWFIGIEPGGPNEGYKESNLLPDKPFYTQPITEDMHSVPVFSRCKEVSEKSGYGDDYFLSNMSPIARRNAAQSNATDENKLREYQKLLFDESKINKPEAIIFHGKGGRYARGFYHPAWGLEKTFELTDVERKYTKYFKNRTIVEFYEKNTLILLCQNFSRNRNSNESWMRQSEKLSTILKEWHAGFV